MSRTASGYGKSSASTDRHNNHPNDFFPLLGAKEIALCLQSCNINVQEENLARPTSQFTQHLFIDLIPPEFLSTTLTKKLEKFLYKHRNSDDESYGEISQSLPIIALQKELYEFMKTCGINDFNFMDIYKPDSLRLIRLLSAIVNFARFKYERAGDYQDLIEISEAQLMKRNQLIDENTELLKHIKELKNKHTHAQDKINEINEYQTKIQKDLKDLKSVQDKLSQEHLSYKVKRNELISKIQEENEKIIKATRENESTKELLHQIDLKMPEKTKNEINEFKTSSTNLKIELTTLDEKYRRTQITLDSMKYIENDITILVNLLNNIKSDLKSSEDQQTKLATYSEIKDSKNNELLNLNRKLQQVQQQIDNVSQKIERYSNQRQERIDSHGQKMKDLQDKYSQIMAEKKAKDKDLSNKRVLLEDIEAKIRTLNLQFEQEENSISYHIAMLCQHIEIYMSKMRSVTEEDE